MLNFFCNACNPTFYWSVRCTPCSCWVWPCMGHTRQKSPLFKLIVKFFLKGVVFMFWHDIVYIELLYCVTNFQLVWTWNKVVVVENAKKCRQNSTFPILFKTNKCHHGGPPWSGGPGAISPVAPPSIRSCMLHSTKSINCPQIYDFFIIHEMASRAGWNCFSGRIINIELQKGNWQPWICHLLTGLWVVCLEYPFTNLGNDLCTYLSLIVNDCCEEERSFSKLKIVEWTKEHH